MMLQAEPSRRTDAASRPARKLISLGVNPSAQAAQWAARRTQKAPKAASAAEVSHLFDPSNPWPLPWLSSLLACADAFNVMAHLDVPQLEAIVLTAFIKYRRGLWQHISQCMLAMCGRAALGHIFRGMHDEGLLLLLQVALDMATVKRSMLEWSLSDICEESTDVSRGLPKMQDAYASAKKHSAAFHRLLLAEFHAGIKQVCALRPGQCNEQESGPHSVRSVPASVSSIRGCSGMRPDGLSGNAMWSQGTLVLFLLCTYIPLWRKALSNDYRDRKRKGRGSRSLMESPWR